MSEIKHTPGPWRPNKRFTTILDANGDERMSGIAEIRTWMGLETQKANAHLISAAPDLLTACKEALGAFEHNWAINWDDLQRAIDKAEGRTTK